MPDQLFCYIRKRWISATPEEKIRQLLIKQMIEELNYPQNYFITEKGLNQMPHLNPASLASLPARRLDLIVLAKDLHPNYPLYPLLLIECKAIPITNKAIRQATGYNHFLKACFVALANSSELLLSWVDPEQQTHQIVKGLPDYPTLLHRAKSVFKVFI